MKEEEDWRGTMAWWGWGCGWVAAEGVEGFGNEWASAADRSTRRSPPTTSAASALFFFSGGSAGE